MSKKLFTLILFSLILSGCGKQTATLIINTDQEVYNLGQAIEICLDITNAPQNIESVHFWLELSGSEQSASQTTWMASETNLRDCYDLTALKWSKGFSSLATDHDKEFYSTVTEGGQYLLKISLAVPKDNDDFDFIKAPEKEIIIRKLIW